MYGVGSIQVDLVCEYGNAGPVSINNVTNQTSKRAIG